MLKILCVLFLAAPIIYGAYYIYSNQSNFQNVAKSMQHKPPAELDYQAYTKEIK